MIFSHFSFLWQAFLIVCSLLTSFTLWLIYKLVIRPLIRLNFYKKQGLECRYYPLIGRYYSFGKDLKTHKDSEYSQKVGSKVHPCRAICSNLASDASVLLFDPELIKEFCLGVDNYIKDPFFLELLKLVLGNGLVTSTGNVWKTQRKTISSIFHFEFLKSNLPIIQSTIHKTLHDLGKTSMTDVNILDVSQVITGEVVGKIFFGEKLNDLKLDGKPLTLSLIDLTSEIVKTNVSLERFVLGTWFIKQGFLPKHRKLMNKAKAYRDICRRIVEERKQSRSAGKKDEEVRMLELLLDASVDEEEIIDQFSSFFLAGMDTTAHLVAIALYHLHQYPEVKEKIIQEMNQYYKPEGITIEGLNQLEYMMAFLKETLRMMTPVPAIIPRKAIRDHKLGDIFIKKGDRLDIELFYNSYNEAFFSEADKFDPTRWLDKDKTMHPYAFTPFFAGPRNCIGQHLALIETRIILAEFLRMYDSKMKEGYDLVMEARLMYEPVNPILLDLTSKTS